MDQQSKLVKSVYDDINRMSQFQVHSNSDSINAIANREVQDTAAKLMQQKTMQMENLINNSSNFIDISSEYTSPFCVIDKPTSDQVPLKKLRVNGGQQSTERIANDDNENDTPNPGTTSYLEDTDHTNVDDLANDFHDIEKPVPQDILLAEILDKTSSDPILYGLQKQTNDNAEMDNLINEHLETTKLSMEEELNRLEMEINAVHEENNLLNDKDFLLHYLPEVDSTDSDLQKSSQSEKDCRPIYEGAAITIGVSMLLIMTFATRHGLTGEALSDLLTLINLHCLAPNHLDKTIYMFKKQFQNLKTPLVYHYYCSKCLINVPDKHQKICANTYCSLDFSKSGNLAFFIEVPIVNQLQDLFSKQKFIKNLNYRFNRKTKHTVISDVYDGDLYKKHFENGGFLSDKRNISFIYNTDGVPVFKSSSFQIWPLYLAINELPPNYRFIKDNMILAGLWFGNFKPCMLTFLRPFHSALKGLEEDGVSITLPDKTTFVSKSILLMGTCDMPAKAAVCNCVQFNGFYGCFRCKQPGRSFKSAKGGTIHTFPFNRENPKGPIRTHAGNQSDAFEAQNLGKSVDGIKGPSWFSLLKGHDIIKGTSIDYMHSVLQGVMKSLMNLWFNPSFSSEPFNISAKIQDIDKRLSEIKPPNTISRLPRSIDSNRKHFKANELRCFLLFYGAVVLNGILPNVYYEHFMFLSEAIYLLSSSEITPDMLAKADALLQHFCLIFDELYSERSHTINIHSLLHLTEDVFNLGPLWTHSCFAFESFNGQLLKFIHGTQSIAFQIVTAVSSLKKIPEVVKTLLPGTQEYLFYKKLNNESTTESDQNLTYYAGNNFSAIGATNPSFCLPRQVFKALCDFLGYIPESNTVHMFKRLRIGSEVFHCKLYSRVKARNSYTISYTNSDDLNIHFGMVEFYFQYKTPCINCERKIHTFRLFNLAAVQTLQKLNESLIDDKITYGTASHLTIANPPDTNKCAVLPIENIKDKCIYMKISDIKDKVFISKFPNKWECD